MSLIGAMRFFPFTCHIMDDPIKVAPLLGGHPQFARRGEWPGWSGWGPPAIPGERHPPGSQRKGASPGVGSLAREVTTCGPVFSDRVCSCQLCEVL